MRSLLILVLVVIGCYALPPAPPDLAQPPDLWQVADLHRDPPDLRACLPLDLDPDELALLNADGGDPAVVRDSRVPSRLWESACGLPPLQ